MLRRLISGNHVHHPDQLHIGHRPGNEQSLCNNNIFILKKISGFPICFILRYYKSVIIYLIFSPWILEHKYVFVFTLQFLSLKPSGQTGISGTQPLYGNHDEINSYSVGVVVFGMPPHS